MTEAIDDALLIVAELVTNAAKIGEVFQLTLSRQGGMALIEVWDGSEALPDRRCRSIDSVDGRGLLLVEACSKDGAGAWRSAAARRCGPSPAAVTPPSRRPASACD